VHSAGKSTVVGTTGSNNHFGVYFVIPAWSIIIIIIIISMERDKCTFEISQKKAKVDESTSSEMYHIDRHPPGSIVPRTFVMFERCATSRQNPRNRVYY
jgi:hypothetical protein